MLFVADVPRSIAFYEKLGFSVGNTFAAGGAPNPTWAWLESGHAGLMVALAEEPVDPERQALILYIYVDDVAKAHAELAAAGLEPGPICTPFYAPNGEFLMKDPDGFSLSIMHT